LPVFAAVLAAMAPCSHGGQFGFALIGHPVSVFPQAGDDATASGLYVWAELF